VLQRYFSLSVLCVSGMYEHLVAKLQNATYRKSPTPLFLCKGVRKTTVAVRNKRPNQKQVFGFMTNVKTCRYSGGQGCPAMSMDTNHLL